MKWYYVFNATLWIVVLFWFTYSWLETRRVPQPERSAPSCTVDVSGEYLRALHLNFTQATRGDKYPVILEIRCDSTGGARLTWNRQ